MTWDIAPNKSSRATLSNGNLTATGDGAGSVGAVVMATVGKAAGKWYFEVEIGKPSFSSEPSIGLTTGEVLTEPGAIDNMQMGAENFSWGILGNGEFYHTGVSWASGFGATSGGSVVMVAFDMDAGAAWIGVNGTFSGDPAAGTGAAFTDLYGTCYPAASVGSGLAPSATLHCAPSSFAFAQPAGFAAIRA